MRVRNKNMNNFLIATGNAVHLLMCLDLKALFACIAQRNFEHNPVCCIFRSCSIESKPPDLLYPDRFAKQANNVRGSVHFC